MSIGGSQINALQQQLDSLESCRNPQALKPAETKKTLSQTREELASSD